MNSYNTIINNVIVNHNLGIVFWYSDEWSTQALNDESGLRYDVISNNTLVNNLGSFKWDASPAHVGTTIQNNVDRGRGGDGAALPAPGQERERRQPGSQPLVRSGSRAALPVGGRPDGSRGLRHGVGAGQR